MKPERGRVRQQPWCSRETRARHSDFGLPSDPRYPADNARRVNAEFDSQQQVHVDSTDEEIATRAAGIDVAKDPGMVCTPVPCQSQPGRRTTTGERSGQDE
jgi:hypothetical protein